MRRRTVVTAGRRNAAVPRPVGNIRVTIAFFEEEGYELGRHVVESDCSVMHLRAITRVLGEVRRAGYCRCAVNRWQQGEVSAGVIHKAAAEGHRVAVLIEPSAQISHCADEHLLWLSVRSPSMAVDAAGIERAGSHLRRETVGIVRAARCAASVFATGVARDGEGCFIEKVLGLVVKLHLRAVIGVNTRAGGRAGLLFACIVFAQAVVVEDEVEVSRRTPQNLPAETWLAVVAGIRLPTIDDPRLDFQLCSREPLDAEAVKEPGSIGGDERWLIGPIVEVVVTEKADIGNKDTGINVEAMIHIPVISTPGLRDIFVCAC